MKGLLETLKEHSHKKEDFVTDVFAWILRVYRDFSEYFLEHILSNPGMYLPTFNVTDCKWVTQYDLGGFYPDMVCLSRSGIGRSAILFEHKLWAGLHDGQLTNYRQLAYNRFGVNNVKIVLITGRRVQHAQNPDLALCWSDVYNLIEEWNIKNSSFVFRDFLRLLESEGMSPPSPIQYWDIVCYYPAVRLVNSVSRLIDYIDFGGLEHCVGDAFELYKRVQWGRIGIEVLHGWTPGIFVGVLLDGDDHRTKPVDAKKGPDFCLVVDFAKTLHRMYPDDEDYIRMIGSLQEKVGMLGGGWQLYNHIEDAAVDAPNKWHPLHVRKPMLDVFAGSTTLEEQARIFYETSCKLVEMVANDEYFLRLRDKFEGY